MRIKLNGVNDCTVTTDSNNAYSNQTDLMSFGAEGDNAVWLTGYMGDIELMIGGTVGQGNATNTSKRPTLPLPKY